ncbi:MAG: methyltransferase domain-containing protein [Deltaproteobacteria bacterium]|nr:methyltransferase domain-containing protein [Deltaproteobacteria bacterium]
MKDSGEKKNLTRERYDRIAPWYDFFEGPMEWLKFRGWRKRLLGRISGENVLEAGVGTGKNLPYYPAGERPVAVDLSFKMLERARKRAKGLSMGAPLIQMDIQHMGFNDNRFDMVLATFVFCSVPDPVEGLREMRRVCRPGGRLLLLEHMRPENPLLGALFDLMNPLTKRITGADINRRTIDNIRKAGWKIRKEEKLFLDIVRLIEAEPEETR